MPTCLHRFPPRRRAALRRLLVAAVLGLSLLLAACGPGGAPPSAISVPEQHPIRAPQISLLQQTGDLPIQAFVAGAQRTLDCELYEVTTATFADALGAAAQRGVRVRVILEPRAWSTLLVQREGAVQVLPTPRVLLDHTKSCVRDAGTPAMAALVGTANWSASAVDKDADLEVALPGSDPAAQQVAGVIEADVRGAAPPLPPRSFGADEAVVSPFNARDLLASFVAQPGSRLLVTSEELRDPSMLALLSEATRREPVDVAAPDGEATPGGTQRCTSPLYMHAKVMVLWQAGRPALAFLGSENLSTQSLDGNREIGVVLGAAAAQQLATAMQQVLQCPGWTV